MRNISVKLFCIRTSGSGDVVLRYFLYPAERDHLGTFGRGQYEERFWELF